MGFKVLGQLVPTAGPTLQDLYACPSDGGCVLSYLNICNPSLTTDDQFSWSIAPGGASAAPKHVQDSLITIPKGSSVKISVSVPIGFTDVVRVTSSGGLLAVTAGGMEYTT